jgi:hypothetical protein
MHYIAKAQGEETIFGWYRESSGSTPYNNLAFFGRLCQSAGIIYGMFM